MKSFRIFSHQPTHQPTHKPTHKPTHQPTHKKYPQTNICPIFHQNRVPCL
ncbi:MAG: PT domain-containing protein [Flavobacteriales bacterium]|nr:PT domain-containing protein [Flavobacteriales bacterium]